MNLVKAVEKRLSDLERNTAWLQRKSGVSKTALYAFMLGNNELRLANLEMLANDGLGIKLSTLIKEAEQYEH